MRALPQLMAAALVLALSVAARAGEPVAEDADEHQHDTRTAADGSPYRVGFDPGTRLFLGGGYAPGFAKGSDPEAKTAYLEVAAGYRHRWDFDDGVSWKFQHRILESRLLLRPGADPAAEVCAYDGEYMRWSRDGQLTFPPNARVPFPFDIGFDARIGALRLRPFDPGLDAELAILHSDIIIGFWRSRAFRTAIQLGFGPRYDLLLSQADPEASVEVIHAVTPFSGGTLTLHHESSDGHHAVELEASPAYSLHVNERWVFSARARASYELILLAINDLPLSAYVETTYEHTAAPRPGRSEHELRGTAGLRFSIPLAD